MCRCPHRCQPGKAVEVMATETEMVFQSVLVSLVKAFTQTCLVVKPDLLVDQDELFEQLTGGTKKLFNGCPGIATESNKRNGVSKGHRLVDALHGRYCDQATKD